MSSLKFDNIVLSDVIITNAWDDRQKVLDYLNSIKREPKDVAIIKVGDCELRIAYGRDSKETNYVWSIIEERYASDLDFCTNILQDEGRYLFKALDKLAIKKIGISDVVITDMGMDGIYIFY